MNDDRLHADPEFSPPRVFISYSRKDGRPFAEDFERLLEKEGLTSWRDLKDIESGDVRFQALQAIEEAEHLVLVLSRASLASDWVEREYRHAWARGKKVSPILIGDLSLRKRYLPLWIRRGEVFDLSEPERWNKLVAILKGPGERRRIPWMRGHLPLSYIRRSTEFNGLKDGVLAASGSSVALVGAGGYGKTVLANDLCRDETVRFQFWDGVLRIEVGKTRTSTLDLITDLIQKLHPKGKRSGFTDEMVAAEHLREVIGEGSILLIIDDVWRESQLLPFLFDAPNCVRLITTRKSDVVPKSCKQIRIDEMQPAEAIKLLSWNLSIDKPATQAALSNLASRLEGWAQLLEISNGFLSTRIQKGESTAKALDTFVRRLDRRGLTAFDARDEDQRNRAIGLCVDASTEDLDKCLELPRFQELAVLPQDVPAPIDTIAALWNQTGQFDPDEVEELLERLSALSLLQELDLSSRSVRLHDNMKSVLRDRLGPDGLRVAHNAMVDALAASSEGDWARLPEKDLYGWHYLVYHLREAQRDAEADALFFDYPWLKNKNSIVGAYALYAGCVPIPQNANAALVARAIGVSLPTISRSPEQFAWIMWSRLAQFQVPELQSFNSNALQDQQDLRAAPWSFLPVSRVERFRLPAHEPGTTCVAVLPNGRDLISGGLDANLRIWDLTNFTEKPHILSGHTGGVLSLALSKDGSRLASAGGDGSLVLWDLETRTIRWSYEGSPLFATTVDFSPDGRLLVGGMDGDVYIWDADAGEAVDFIEMFPQNLTALTVSGDGMRIAAGDGDGALRIFDLSKGNEVAAFQGHEARVQAVRFSPDDRLLASCGNDGTVRLWSSSDGSEMDVLPGHPSSRVADLAFLSEGSRLLTGGLDGNLRLWDVTGGKVLETLRAHEHSVNCLAIDDEGHFISGSMDGTVRSWETASDRSPVARNGHDALIKAVCLSSSGQKIASGGADGSIRVWDALAGTELMQIDEHLSGVGSLCFAPDERALIVGDNAGTITVYDVETGTETSRSVCHSGKEVLELAVNADGSQIWSFAADGTLFKIDRASGVSDLVFSCGDNKIAKACLSCDKTLLATTVSSPKETDAESFGEIKRLDMSPDQMMIWDLKKNELKQITTTGHRHVTSIALDAAGNKIATVGIDGVARLWDANEHSLLQSFQTHHGPWCPVGPYDAPSHERWLLSVAVSPNGMFVAAGGDDGNLWVWDAKTATPIAQRQCDATVRYLTCSNEGLVCATGAGLLFRFEFLL